MPSVPAIPPADFHSPQPASPQSRGDAPFADLLDAAVDSPDPASPLAPQSGADARLQALTRGEVKGAHDILSSRVEKAGAGEQHGGSMLVPHAPTIGTQPTSSLQAPAVAAATAATAATATAEVDGKMPDGDAEAEIAETEVAGAQVAETEIVAAESARESSEVLSADGSNNAEAVVADANPDPEGAPEVFLADSEAPHQPADVALSSEAADTAQAANKIAPTVAANALPATPPGETTVNVQSAASAVAHTASPAAEPTSTQQPAPNNPGAKAAIEPVAAPNVDREAQPSPPPAPSARPQIASAAEPTPPEPAKPAMPMPDAAAPKAPPLMSSEPVRMPAPALNVAGLQAEPNTLPLKAAAIAVEIVSRLHEGTRRFDIRLDPPELGRVDVRLEMDRSGNVTTKLTLDRPETLELMQRDARGLERALQQAGLKTDAGGLEFSLRQHADHGAQERHRTFNEARPDAFAGDEHSAPLVIDGYKAAAYARGGVDIRI